MKNQPYNTLDNLNTLKESLANNIEGDKNRQEALGAVLLLIDRYQNVIAESDQLIDDSKYFIELIINDINRVADSAQSKEISEIKKYVLKALDDSNDYYLVSSRRKISNLAQSLGENDKKEPAYESITNIQKYIAQIIEKESRGTAQSREDIFKSEKMKEALDTVLGADPKQTTLGWFENKENIEALKTLESGFKQMANAKNDNERGAAFKVINRAGNLFAHLAKKPVNGVLLNAHIASNLIGGVKDMVMYAVCALSVNRLSDIAKAYRGEQKGQKGQEQEASDEMLDYDDLKDPNQQEQEASETGKKTGIIKRSIVTALKMGAAPIIGFAKDVFYAPEKFVDRVGDRADNINYAYKDLNNKSLNERNKASDRKYKVKQDNRAAMKSAKEFTERLKNEQKGKGGIGGLG